MQKKYVLNRCLALGVIFFANIVLAETNNQTIIPLHFGSDFSVPNVIPWVELTIENKNIPVLLDSGLGTTDIALFPKALKKIKVRYTKEEICGISISGKDCQKVFIIPEIKLGDLVVHNVRGVAAMTGGDEEYKQKLGKTSKDTFEEGLLGFHFLKKFNVFLDYQRQKMILLHDYSYPDFSLKNWMKIPFETKNDFIGTNGTLAGLPIRLTWDTGAAPSKIKKISALRGKTFPCPENYNTVAKSPQCYKANDLKIDNQYMPASIFVYSLELPDIAPLDGFIGANFHYENRLFFDFKQHLIYIQRTPNRGSLSKRG